MNVKTDHTGGVAIVRVGETRLMYPILSDFSTAVSGLVVLADELVGDVEHLAPVLADDLFPRELIALQAALNQRLDRVSGIRDHVG